MIHQFYRSSSFNQLIEIDLNAKDAKDAKGAIEIFASFASFASFALFFNGFAIEKEINASFISFSVLSSQFSVIN